MRKIQDKKRKRKEAKKRLNRRVMIRGNRRREFSVNLKEREKERKGKNLKFLVCIRILERYVCIERDEGSLQACYQVSGSKA